jgi:predicted glutamine amidotransferase
MVTSTFWLLDAPDSLAAQSHRNPDGAGIGVFGAGGEPHVDKQPIAAWDDTEFAAAARELTGTTFVAHVRHATTGAHTVANTHPFEQRGRLFAHNGVVEGLDQLDTRLRELDAFDLVHGETDSERVFALITAETARHDADVTAGVRAAIGWIVDHLPVFSVNFILCTATDMWALRYPAADELWILERSPGGSGEPSVLDAKSRRIHARSPAMADRRCVVFASERMDDDPGWRLLPSGALVHVHADLTVETTTPFPSRPAHQLTMSDLAPAAAASQQPTP